MERIRISSIEPNLLTNEMIDFIARSNLFVPHFHIPLQSGSDKILADMRRRYKRELYADRVDYIKKIIPDCCIGVDVIVGFPTETEELFNETYRFLQSLDIAYLHVFSYSERANTKAIDLENVVSIEQKKDRSRLLHGLSEEKRNKYYDQFNGKKRYVLFENAHDGVNVGHTDNYIKVEIQDSRDLSNQIHEVSLTENRSSYMVGKF